MYNWPIDIISIEVNVATWLHDDFGLFHGHHHLLTQVICVQVIAKLFPKEKLVVLERDKVGQLKFGTKVFLDRFVAHVMHLNANEASALFGHQVTEMIAKELVVPFLE